MHSTPARRIVGIFALLVCLLGLMVWFGSLTPAPAVGAYPGATDLGTEYGAWVGEQASLTGTVVETDPLTISVEYGTGEHMNLQVTDTDIEAQQGDRLAVFGVVEAGHTIRSLNAYTIPASSYVYMYVVSFVAGVWVLARLLRDWRLDWETWSLEPRKAPLSVSGFLTQRHPTEDQDA